MSGCQCYQVGGPFIAEDPDCPAHGADARMSPDPTVSKMEKVDEPLCERTLRKVLEVLPTGAVYWDGAAKEQAAEARAVVEALLPKPDPAKALVEQISEMLDNDPVCCGRVTIDTMERIAGLLSQGKIRP